MPYWSIIIRIGLNRFVPFQLFYTFAYSRGPLTVSWIEGWHEHDAASSDWELLAMLYGEWGEGREWEEAEADWINSNTGRKKEEQKKKAKRTCSAWPS